MAQPLGSPPPFGSAQNAPTPPGGQSRASMRAAEFAEKRLDDEHRVAERKQAVALGDRMGICVHDVLA